jgi:hypothetical protein
VLRLYFIFLRDALRLTALSAAAYVLLAAALLRFGASAAALQIPLLQVALFGLLFLSRRYAGRNIEWILGLAQRKRALAWYNFALNLSHLAMISSATALVLFAIDSLSADSGWHPPFVLQPARLLDLPELHGRALAFALFILTAALFSCWTISRPPTASNFARRQRFLLLGWVTVASLFTYLTIRGHGALAAALSPLVLFAGGTGLVGVGATYSTAKALGTSLRQRRTWMTVGGAIALAEVLVLATLAMSDLRSGDPAIREQATRLLGTTASPSIP